MQRFLGIDLAWSPRNASGVAALVKGASGVELLACDVVGSDTAILEFVAAYTGSSPAIIAVDAPLWVPNLNGRRPAEAELAAAFRRFDAGPHPANRRLLAFDGVVRGEALVAALARRGFVHAPAISAALPARQVVEVFPHPAMVAIFGLPRILKYKARPGRSAELRFAELDRYRQLLGGLAAADPPLQGAAPLLAEEPRQLRGQALKHYEDRLDALFCAYIAAYAYRWGSARCRVFGSLRQGYIFTPVPFEV